MKLPANESEAKLLKEAQGGENELRRRNAFSALMVPYEPKLHKWANEISLNLKVDAVDIPDVVNEVMVKAWRGIHTFRGDSKLSTWLYTITRNHLYNYSKWNQRYENIHTFSEFEESGWHSSDAETDRRSVVDRIAHNPMSPEEQFFQAEITRKMSQIVEGLPTSLRSVYILREYEGMRYEAIAKRTGLKLGTVKTQIHRAREKVRVELKQWARDGLQDEDY